MFLLYNITLYCFFLLAGPYYLLHLLMKEHYRAGLRQRLGFVKVPPKQGYRIWFHGVSVGEIQTLAALAETLAGQRAKGLPIEPVYSTTTLTGQRLARAKLPGHRSLFYFPLDFGFAVRRALYRVRPDMVVLAETELWPNFLNECRRRNVRVILVNGRISPRSFRRYSLMRRFTRIFLPFVEIFLMQNEEYARRIIALGAPAEKVSVTGNMKADAPAVTVKVSASLEAVFAAFSAGPRRIVVAGSTHEGEEAVLARCFGAWKAAVPGVCLVLAPRHLKRVQAIRQYVQGLGLSCSLRSTFDARSESPPDVLLLDTLGELAAAYQWAELVFVGKSLLARGGQNPLEAAGLARPVVFGPHMENFPTESAVLLQEGGALRVGDEEELSDVIARLLRDEDARNAMGEGAKRAVEKMRGATQKNVQRIMEVLNWSHGS